LYKKWRETEQGQIMMNPMCDFHKFSYVLENYFFDYNKEYLHFYNI